MSRSSILLLTSCSNAKDAGASDSGYDSSRGIGRLLRHHSAELLRKRKDVLHLLRGDSISRHGVLLRELPYNRSLRAHQLCNAPNNRFFYRRSCAAAIGCASRAPMNLSESETQPNNSWITKRDAS